MQHLLVGVNIFYNVLQTDILSPFLFLIPCLIATHMEMVVSLLHRNAAHLIKTVLAGTVTAHFTDVIEGVFARDEPPSIHEGLKEAPAEEEEEEGEEDEEIAQACASSSKAIKRKQPGASTSSSKCKVAHPTRGGMCTLDTAKVYYPQLSDEGNHLHTGVDSHFISSRKSSTHTAAARYSCLFSQVMKSDGQIIPDSDVI